jgi:hypothetical protein
MCLWCLWTCRMLLSILWTMWLVLCVCYGLCHYGTYGDLFIAIDAIMMIWWRRLWWYGDIFELLYVPIVWNVEINRKKFGRPLCRVHTAKGTRGANLWAWEVRDDQMVRPNGLCRVLGPYLPCLCQRGHTAKGGKPLGFAFMLAVTRLRTADDKASGARHRWNLCQVVVEEAHNKRKTISMLLRVRNMAKIIWRGIVS